MQNIEHYEIKNGITLHYAKTQKYKTNMLSFYFYRKLAKNEVTLNALLTLVLKRACGAFPKTADLERFLEDQYGSYIESGVRKKGDVQVLHFNFNYLHPKYANGKDINDNIFTLARSILFDQTSFDEEIVRQEKQNLKEQIEAVINNKAQYAQMRCTSQMCAREPYGIYELGDIAFLDTITADSLYNHYKNILLSTKLDIFITGEIDINWAVKRIIEMTRPMSVHDENYPSSIIIDEIYEVKRETERQQVNQGKLVMGFRTRTKPQNDDYFPIMVYNSLYGGSVFSKLFNNVREKLSLAYSVSSRVDKFKGVMFVNAGIELNNFQIAYDEIMLQEKMVKDGDFTEDELIAAKLSIINSIKSIADDPRQTEDYYVGQLLCGRDEDLDELASEIEKVTAGHVRAAADRVELDTIYFLTGEE